MSNCSLKIKIDAVKKKLNGCTRTLEEGWDWGPGKFYA